MPVAEWRHVRRSSIFSDERGILRSSFDGKLRFAALLCARVRQSRLQPIT